MPTPALCTRPPSCCRGYAFAAECIHLETISPPSHSTVHLISAIIDNNSGNVLKYCHLMKMDKHKKVWAHSFANEIGKLFQGIRNVPGTDTCFFTPKSLVPAHKCPPYRHICCSYRPQKEEKHCIRLTIGDNWTDYPGMRAHQWPISPRLNYSSIPPSVPLGPSFWASTLQISTSTPPCQTPCTCVSIST